MYLLKSFSTIQLRILRNLYHQLMLIRINYDNHSNNSYKVDFSVSSNRNKPFLNNLF